MCWNDVAPCVSPCTQNPTRLLPTCLRWTRRSSRTLVDATWRWAVESFRPLCLPTCCIKVVSVLDDSGQLLDVEIRPVSQQTWTLETCLNHWKRCESLLNNVNSGWPKRPNPLVGDNRGIYSALSHVKTPWTFDHRNKNMHKIWTCCTRFVVWKGKYPLWTHYRPAENWIRSFLFRVPETRSQIRKWLKTLWFSVRFLSFVCTSAFLLTFGSKPKVWLNKCLCLHNFLVLQIAKILPDIQPDCQKEIVPEPRASDNATWPGSFSSHRKQTVARVNLSKLKQSDSFARVSFLPRFCLNPQLSAISSKVNVQISNSLRMGVKNGPEDTLRREPTWKAGQNGLLQKNILHLAPPNATVVTDWPGQSPFNICPIWTLHANHIQVYQMSNMRRNQEPHLWNWEVNSPHETFFPDVSFGVFCCGNPSSAAKLVPEFRFQEDSSHHHWTTVSLLSFGTSREKDFIVLTWSNICRTQNLKASTIEQRQKLPTKTNLPFLRFICKFKEQKKRCVLRW